MKKLLFYSLIAIAASSCSDAPEAPKQNFVTVGGIDASIKPGDDFFMYVNKTWYDTATIADDQVGVGSYSFLNIPQKIKLQNILQEVSSTEHPAGSIEQKVGDFYAAGMDTVAINQRGFEPIQPILDRIAEISDVSDLMSFIAQQAKVGDYSLISFGVYPDRTNSSMNIAHFGQTGLGLPDRDYYFKTDSSTLAIQVAYKQYLISLFGLTGSNISEAQLNAELVYSIEKLMAESHKTRVERRVIKNNFHNMAVADMNATHRSINWSKLLGDLGLETDTIDIRQPAYFDTLDKMLADIDIDHWKIYLKANSIGSYDQYLSDPFKKAAFEYTKVLSGRDTALPRAQVIANAVDRQLGFALGQLYVKRYFTEEAKKRALVLVNNLQKAFESRINELDWMSDSTKLQAKEKLYAITKKGRLSGCMAGV